VIIGGGFAGIAAAKALRHCEADVTVVDRRNHHIFQPLLYQAATAVLAPSDVAAPIRQLSARQQNVSVLLAEVIGVDLTSRTIDVKYPDAGDKKIAFDYLVRTDTLGELALREDINLTFQEGSQIRSCSKPGPSPGESLRRPMWRCSSAVIYSTSPGPWGLPHGLPEVLAKVRLVGEAAPQRNVTQARIGRKHVLSGQFHATSHDEGVR
jgi:hypothetical protein